MEDKKNIANGSIQRHRKSKDFTIISNDCVLDKPPLSLEAKGLLWQMFSLPDNWNHSIGGYKALCGVGERRIKRIFAELKERGYLFIEKISPKFSSTGRFAYIYHIYDEKQEVQNVPLENEKQEAHFVGVEIEPLQDEPLQDEPLQNDTLNKELNNKELNTKEPITKEPTKKDKKNKPQKNSFGEFKNVFLNEEHIQKLKELYKTEKKYKEAIETLSAYKERSGKTYKNDYAVLIESNWVFKKVYPNGVPKDTPKEENGNKTGKYGACY